MPRCYKDVLDREGAGEGGGCLVTRGVLRKVRFNKDLEDREVQAQVEDRRGEQVQKPQAKGTVAVDLSEPFCGEDFDFYLQRYRARQRIEPRRDVTWYLGHNGWAIFMICQYLLLNCFCLDP